MLFHKNVTYGIKAVLYLAGLEKGVIHSSKEISNKLHIPKEYTSKILQSLTKSGIILSKRGHKGGFCLGKEPGKIRLVEIILELNDSANLELCLFGFPDCNLSSRCALHEPLEELIKQLHNIVHNYSIEDLRSVG